MSGNTSKQVKLSEAPAINSSDPVRLELWVRAGGRCEFRGCNKYLLDDDFTGYKLVNLADIAHVVGRKKAAARGSDPMPYEDRNKISNLILLCSEHHNKIIDKRKLSPDFPKERLLKDKQEHEDLIKCLTSLALPGFASVTLRMVGNIRGNAVAVPDEQVRLAVLGAKRYPRYLLRQQSNIEINLTTLDENNLDFWNQGFKVIDNIVDRQVTPAIIDKSIEHLSVFSFARIPFIIYLGYKIGDKVSIDIYQKQRDEGEMWTWRDVSPVQFEYRKLRDGTNKAKIALFLSLSGSIDSGSTPLDEQFTIYEILPAGIQPGRSVFEVKQTLDEFRKKYAECLRFVEKTHKEADALHLFPATPLSAAFHCARELLKGTTPKMVIYDRDNNAKFIKITEIV